MTIKLNNRAHAKARETGLDKRKVKSRRCRCLCKFYYDGDHYNYTERVDTSVPPNSNFFFYFLSYLRSSKESAEDVCVVDQNCYVVSNTADVFREDSFRVFDCKCAPASSNLSSLPATVCSLSLNGDLVFRCWR